MPTVQRDGEVFVLDLGEDENRFSPEWLRSFATALDEVEAGAGPRALVTTGGGRFYSNGLEPARLETDERDGYLVAVHAALARVLALPMVTVAAVQGHAFGGGAMLALAHDVSVMRRDRGWWCLPEMELGIPFSRAMAGLVQSRLSPPVAHAAMVLAGRYGGEDARAAGIVDRLADEHTVRSDAVDLAGQHARKAGHALGTAKARMYSGALALLRDPQGPLA